jgi:hypothetical protein
MAGLKTAKNTGGTWAQVVNGRDSDLAIKEKKIPQSFSQQEHQRQQT